MSEAKHGQCKDARAQQEPMNRRFEYLSIPTKITEDIAILAVSANQIATGNLPSQLQGTKEVYQKTPVMKHFNGKSHRLWMLLNRIVINGSFNLGILLVISLN